MTSSSPKNAVASTAAEIIDTLTSYYTAMLDNIQHNVKFTRNNVTEIEKYIEALSECTHDLALESLQTLFLKVRCHLKGLYDTPEMLSTDTIESFWELNDLIQKFLDPKNVSAQTDLLIQASDLARAFDSHSEHLALLQSNAPDDGVSAENLEQAPQSESIDDPLDVSSEELATYEKYLTRADEFFACELPAGTVSSHEELSNSTPVDSLMRVGEIVLLRARKTGSVILFTAELPADMLSELAGFPVRQLEKNPSMLSELPEPWCQIKFSSKIASSDKQLAQPSTTTPSAPPPSSKAAPSTPAPTKAAPSSAAPTTPTAAVSSEDFDTKNLAEPTDMSAVDPEMLQDFLANADELLEKLSASILDLESNPSSKEAIEQIFRAAHTIKGTAGMFGFRAIQRLTHVMESLFDQIRKGQVVATTSHIDAVLFGFDKVRSMFDMLRNNNPPEMPINDALANLEASMRGEQIITSKPSATAAPTTTKASESEQNTPPVANKAQNSSSETTKPPAPANANASPKKDDSSGTIRVDLKRLDSLVNLVGELVIDRTRFALIEEEIRSISGNSDLLHSMSEAVLLFGRHMNEVQSVIMKIRMVPVGNAFTKFSRVIRDLARDCGKEIDLSIEGGDAELDKTLVEEIGDPLIHLVRNSVDHGIESPEDREKAGKPRRGQIKIRAYQDSNMIVIQVKDDGRGLQLEKLRKKAIQNGLIKDTEVLSDKETFALIFEAGFSTAEKVTNISGRGVGMDVVKRNITKLKGIIELDSTVGHGTTTTIKLPLTLAIIPSLMVQTHGETYAIPLVNVIESIRISPEDIQRIGSVDFVKLRDKALPLLNMSSMFGLENIDERMWYGRNGDSSRSFSRSTEKSATLSSAHVERRNQNPKLIFVVVGSGERRIGLIVERLQGQQEIVIKSLGNIIGKPAGIAGGCVLGNGKVALVMDIGEIVEEMGRGRASGVLHE